MKGQKDVADSKLHCCRYSIYLAVEVVLLFALLMSSKFHIGCINKLLRLRYQKLEHIITMNVRAAQTT